MGDLESQRITVGAKSILVISLVLIGQSAESLDFIGTQSYPLKRHMKKKNNSTFQISDHHKSQQGGLFWGKAGVTTESRHIDGLLVD